MKRVAIVLFNLGGPDSPDAIKPFLFNLFKDPAIIRLPWPLRMMLAWLISTRRAPTAREIYDKIGGRSPLLGETEAQAKALVEELDEYDVRTFVCMRYWHPMARETAAEVLAFAPDEVVLLPLYPQFSGTTTGSSFDDWQAAARRVGLDAPTRKVCCYPDQPGFIDALAARVREDLGKASEAGMPRVLFSAHGLPEKYVEAGDPYREQIECTVSAVTEKLAIGDLDYTICYQSRVGRQEWLKPYTKDELMRAGADGVPVVMAPVAFVSEHSETLVELDLEYAALAKEAGVPKYVRVPTVGVAPEFISGLAMLVRKALGDGVETVSWRGGRICSAGFADCPLVG